MELLELLELLVELDELLLSLVELDELLFSLVEELELLSLVELELLLSLVELLDELDSLVEEDDELDSLVELLDELVELEELESMLELLLKQIPSTNVPNSQGPSSGNVWDAVAPTSNVSPMTISPIICINSLSVYSSGIEPSIMSITHLISPLIDFNVR
jgi:hypothetical protein